MNSAIMKKVKSGLAAVCAAALLTAGLPGGFLDAGVAAKATGEDQYYYAPARLYDFKYDTEVIPDYRYTYTQSGCPDARGGNRWHNGSQVPYEKLNWQISKYYTENAGLNSQPALYFGNYWGSSSDCYKDIEKQFTVGSNNQKVRYYDDNYGYENFWVSANNAPGAANGYAAVQGLVDSQLMGFEASVAGSGEIAQNNVRLPQFNNDFIDESDYCERYTVNNGFPFDKRTNMYGQTVYYYDSLNKNNGKDNKIAGKNRYYNKTTGNFEVQNDSTYNYRSDSGIYNKETGFYPFNGTAIVNSDRTGVNYGFGMRLDIPFSLDAGGKANGYPATFTFSGDDDIWVFIDGKLALDLGGDHARVDGSINFASGEVKVSKATLFSDNKSDTSVRAYKETGTTSNLSSKGITIDSSAQSDHVMTVFYMERGLFESNLSMEFTFVPKSEVVAANTNENDLTIKEITEFENVNPGLLSYTKAAADKDSFDYTIESAGSGAGTNPNPNVFPYFKDVYRTNSEAYGKPATLIANDWGEDSPTDTTTGTGTGTKYIYVRKQPNSCCFDAGTRASFSIYLYDSTATNPPTWVNTTYMEKYKIGEGDSGFYFFRGELTDDMISKYDKYILVGYSESATGNTGYATWSPPTGVSKQQIPASNAGGLTFNYGSTRYVIETPGGGDPVLHPDGNLPQSDGSGGTSTTYTKISKNTSLAANNNGALVNIPFALTDPFATEDITGITNATGHFKLLYGEAASFNKQFTKYCTDTPTVITVQQNANVYNRTADEVVVKSTDINTYHQLPYNDTNKRTLSEYYTTKVYATDAEGNSLSDYQSASDCSLDNSNNTYFKFYNKSSDITTASAEGEKPVRITETFVNTIKTTDLQIAKDYTTGSDPSKRFTFKIAFNTVFGVTGIDKTGDYSDIAIYINNKKQSLTEDGEFTITSEDVAVIKGIPVGTKYTVTEKLTNTGYTNDTFTKQVGNNTPDNLDTSSTTDTASTQEQTVAANEAGQTVVIKAKNQLDASAETVGIEVEKRWVSPDEEELKATDLKLLLQRKASDEEGWTDIDTITLKYHSDSDKNVTQSEQSGDYVWTYLKDNLLKYKGAKANNVTYSYRILEYSADGTALLLADEALYTEHCRVTYVENSVDAKGMNNGATGEISLINTYDIPLSVPKAGAEGVRYIFTFGITAIALSGAALMIYKKKLKAESRRERSE